MTRCQRCGGSLIPDDYDPVLRCLACSRSPGDPERDMPTQKFTCTEIACVAVFFSEVERDHHVKTLHVSKPRVPRTQEQKKTQRVLTMVDGVCVECGGPVRYRPSHRKQTCSAECLSALQSKNAAKSGGGKGNISLSPRDVGVVR